MNFLNPGLAAVGLACVAIPILIHILMRRRRRPVQWGAMQFLLAAYRQQRRRMNFEQWLLLASRCLIVALIALAVGKPVLAALGANEGLRARTLYILLDNSLTSQVSTTAGTAVNDELTALKASARSLLSTLSPGQGDRAALITLAGPAKADVLPPAPDATQVSQLIERIEPATSRADIEGALRLVRQAIQEETDAAGAEAVVVLLSGFRAGSADLARPPESLATASRPVRVIAATPAATASDNVSILAAQPLRPLLITGDAASGPDAGSLPVRIELLRSGALATGVTQVRAWLASGGAQSTPQTTVVSWASGQRTGNAFLTLDARGNTADAVLHAETDADAVLADNSFLRPLESVATLRVALVAPSLAAGAAAIDAFASQDWLALALSPQTPNPLRSADASGIRVEVVDPARLSAGTTAPELAGAGAVVVTQPHTLDAGAWRAVAAAASQGAFLVVVPPESESTHTWTDAFADALALPISLSREPVNVGGDEGVALTTQSSLPPDEDLLALVRPELDELVKPVRVRKLLTLQPRAADTRSAPPATLLALADGSPLLISARTQNGSLVVLWLAPPALSWTDVPAKPLMVPLMQELVRQGVGRSGAQRTLTAGHSFRAPPGAAELADVGGSTIVRLDSNANPIEPLRTTGLWHIRSADGRTLSTLAVNHDPAASDTTPQRTDDVERWLAGLSDDVSLLESTPPTAGEAPAHTVLTTRRDAPPVSLPLLIAAGAIALLELALARWFSHAKVGAPSTGGAAA